MESFIGSSCIIKFHHWFYDVGVFHMSHGLVQRMSIILCRPFLITLDFACHPYPQCVSDLHEVVVLSFTLVLLSSLLGNLEPNSRHLLIGHWIRGFPCVRGKEIYSHIGICVVSWIRLSLLVVSSPLSAVFLIGFYSEGLFCALLASGACERHTWSLVHENPICPSSS